MGIFSLEMEYPREADAQVVVVVIVGVVVVDVQAIVVEVADVHAVAVRGKRICRFSSIPLESVILKSSFLNFIREQFFNISTKNQQEVPSLFSSRAG
ncbi:MAG: hypothetical protein G01um101420_72 [Parcubacteria group bacterium Gr01-1014_20]|nr:MAG: hypothetical protein G01um101420_72 [Parcubacteria group bacterium Gr01-1014_20]